MDQRGGILLIYSAMTNKDDTLAYARAWEEDTGCSWKTSELWYYLVNFNLYSSLFSLPPSLPLTLFLLVSVWDTLFPFYYLLKYGTRE